MKRLIAMLLVMVLCFTLVSCSQYTPLAEIPLEQLRESVIYFKGADNVEDVCHMPAYKNARAVPMGKVVLSEVLRRNLKSYDDDDIFYIGVCYAAMVPAHVPINSKSPFDETLKEITERVARDCEAAGMLVRHTGYTYGHYISVFARKHQLLEMRCSSDVALYLFPAIVYL